MRIFVILGNNEQEFVNLAPAFKEHFHEVIYWVGLHKVDENIFPNVIFHNHQEARAGIPAEGIDTSSFLPPGADLIEKLYRVESVFSTIMNRKKFGRKFMDQQKHVYYEMLQYWYGIIKKYKPDVIFFGTIPHAPHNYLIFELAQLLGIKTLLIYDTWVSDRLLLYDDFWKGSNILQAEIEKNKGKFFSLEDLSNDLQDYYKKQINFDHDATPMYMKNLEMQYLANKSFSAKLKIIKESIKDLTIFKRAFNYFSNKRKQSFKKEYISLQIKPNLTKKFIYVPLQYQPECTTSPMGNMFADQILMIKILSASLPEDWVIYVKEHPTQWRFTGGSYSNYRYPEYYQKIVSLKNTFIVSVNIDTYILNY